MELLEEATMSPPIMAGPGGGFHLIANNSITNCSEGIKIIAAPGCRVTGNLES